MRRPLLAAAGLVVAAALFGSSSAAQLPVEHTVVRTWNFGGTLDLATLKPVPQTTVVEIWADKARSRKRDVTRRGGVVVEDTLCAAPACQSGGGTGGTTRAAYRRSILGDLQSGKAQLVRTGVLLGRPVRWIRYGKAGEWSVIVLDRAYHEVREERWHQGRLVNSIETVVDERVPRREPDFVPHAPWPDLAGQSRPEGRLVDSGEAAKAVQGAQWAGDSVAGLKLRAIRERPWAATTTAGDHLSGTILRFRYGDWLGSFLHPRKRMPGRGVEITETRADAPVRWWMKYPWLGGPDVPPRAGLVNISDEPPYAKLGAGDSYYAVGVLQKPGVWLTVRATSYPLLYTTLHSLQPIG